MRPAQNGRSALGASPWRCAPSAAALVVTLISGGCQDSSGPVAATVARSNVAAAPANDVIPDEYIVLLRATPAQVPILAKQLLRGHNAELRYTYTGVLQGFAARIPGQAIEALKRNPVVSLIEEDRVMQADEIQVAPPSWGLDRVDQSALPLSASYSYGPTGAGVHVYIIDTGIRSTHQEIVGRVQPGFSAIADSLGSEDCYGHGTHVAGTVGGASVGVAKEVTLHAVRVLSCTGGGTLTGVVAGLDWVARNRVLPAVANMSLGGGLSSTLNLAVANLAATGVAVTVSAGNYATDACHYSPASAPEAITVGATDNLDAQANYSNYGDCLDLYAPGSAITSSWIGSDTTYRTANGTSMAAPHVAGAAALYLQLNPSASAQQVSDGLTGAATTRALSGLDRSSPNRLLYVGNMVSAPIPAPSPNPPPPTTDEPPVASFSVKCSRWRCAFDGTGSTDDRGVVIYSWDFGNGLSLSGSTYGTVSHSYMAPGTYNVTLTVVDISGQTGAVQRVLKIKRT